MGSRSAVWTVTSLLLWGVGATAGEQPSPGALVIAAIGDAGKAGAPERYLEQNAKRLAELYLSPDGRARLGALLYLGDNFYETGLNGADFEPKVRAVLGPFKPINNALQRERIYAVTGNHDYYTGVWLGLPHGFSSEGNGREAGLPDWTYSYGRPREKIVAVNADEEVQIVFFDSALPLRTPERDWQQALDDLTGLLAATRTRPSVRWRLIALHHPLYSLGDHGQFKALWGWLLSRLDPEDLFDSKYKTYRRRLKAAIRRGGVPVHVLLAGHDHSLQLLYYPEQQDDCAVCPKVHVVSGSGSKVTAVDRPHPPREYAAVATDARGARPKSRAGFVELTFESGWLSLTFCDATTGTAIDMGGGAKEFRVDTRGDLRSEPSTTGCTGR